MLKSKRLLGSISTLLSALLLAFVSCKKDSHPSTAFYYWKSTFQLNKSQEEIVRQATQGKLYVRFFDVNWNEKTSKPFPDAVIHFKQPVKKLTIIPVIYIRNKTFEVIKDADIDSLAFHCNKLVNSISSSQNINYTSIQLDCDWTLATRQKYFTFLKSFKDINHKTIEVTIRLHQAKYKQQAGVPPVDKGVLMFYNMGKLNANLEQQNSIYNEADAAPYIPYLKDYPLPFDVALPLFSWSIQIRNKKALQVYGQIKRVELDNQDNFVLVEKDHIYRAKRSIFLRGVYIKQNDIFKLEETTINSLHAAAQQLTNNLPAQKNRNIIYYELSNLNTSIFKAADLREVSAYF